MSPLVQETYLRLMFALTGRPQDQDVLEQVHDLARLMLRQGIDAVSLVDIHHGALGQVLSRIPSYQWTRAVAAAADMARQIAVVHSMASDAPGALPDVALAS